MTRAELGRRYHCRRVETEGKQTGVFCRREDQISVKLFDFERFFHVQDGEGLHLQLEDNTIVSLHGTVVRGPNQTSYLRAPQATTYSMEVLANSLVAGHGPWTASGEVRTVWFTIPHLDQLLLNRARLTKNLRGAASIDDDTEILFKVGMEAFTLRCWYSLFISRSLSLNELTPVFEIAFSKPRVLATYLEAIHTILRFFSAAAGFRFTPAGLAISALTPAEIAARPSSRQDEIFTVDYVWPAAKVDAYDLHPGCSFVHALDEVNLAALVSCLRAWIARDAGWRKATTLMMGSLGLAEESSGYRLLMACPWLEAIPGAAAAAALSEADVAALTAAAVKEAQALGQDDLEGRIKGALKAIKLEPNRVRLGRLVAAVVRDFGEDAFGGPHTTATVVDALMRAITYRGQEAHSFVAEGADNIMPLVRATAAMEALCYFLTIQVLPLSADGRQRVAQSRFARTWLYAGVSV